MKYRISYDSEERYLMKYRILYDYGSEGRYLSIEEYDTIDEAVKTAIGCYDDFLIINIVNWEANNGGVL